MVQDTYKRVQFYGLIADGGNNSYVSVANHASLNMVDALTVIARVYFDPDDKIMQTTDHALVSKSSGSSPNGGWVLEYVDTVPVPRCFRFSIVSGGVWYSANLVSSVKERGWHYVVATFDSSLGADNLKIFQNTIRQAVATRAAVIDANVRDIIIGGMTTSGLMFKGYIAETQLYNRALTEAEINYNYLHPNNPKRQGLVMSLVQTSIDKPAAGTWKDVSPQTGNNGTITNATTSKYPSISAGRNALFFPTAAKTDRVDCGNGASLNPATTGMLSSECWIKVGKDYHDAAIIFMSKVSVAGVSGWLVGWDSASKVLYLYSDAGGAITSVALPGFWDGSLKHIVFTHTGGAATGEVYVNGINKTNTRTVRALTNPAINLFVANESDSLQFAPVGGFMSSARIYNRILTAEEVLYNYHHPNNPKRRGLVLNLSQESLYGTKWYDLSGNANNGTITGAIAKNIADSLTGD